MRVIESLQPGEYYHIYNRGINGENIFREEKNYSYFLKLYAKYITAVADTYCYCLLKNHFHLLIRIKEKSLLDGKLPHKGLGDFFNAYAQGFNKVYERTGCLFEKPFKRKCIEEDSYFTWLVWYIHSNPERHGLVKDFRRWPNSSYSSILSGKPTLLKREELIEWFGDIHYFIRFHQQKNPDINKLLIE